jgi:hypothetical protein
MSKQLKKLKENSNKQMNEIKKTRQNMKEKILKGIEIMKNNKFQVNSSISQVKISIKSAKKRVEQVEN